MARGADVWQLDADQQVQLAPSRWSQTSTPVRSSDLTAKTSVASKVSYIVTLRRALPDHRWGFALDHHIDYLKLATIEDDGIVDCFNKGQESAGKAHQTLKIGCRIVRVNGARNKDEDMIKELLGSTLVAELEISMERGMVESFTH